MDITYFMVEVEAVETNIHIAAVTVEDASPIFVLWIANCPSMKLAGRILCLRADWTMKVPCIEADLQITLFGIKGFVIYNGGFAV
jgi:hypothetical protein